MKKVITMSIFGVGGNNRGSSFNGSIVSFVVIDEALQFDEIRENLKNNWKQFLKEGTAVTKEFRYKCTVCIISDNGTRFKIFEIDPKEIK